MGGCNVVEIVWRRHRSLGVNSGVTIRSSTYRLSAAADRMEAVPVGKKQEEKKEKSERKKLDGSDEDVTASG